MLEAGRINAFQTGGRAEIKGNQPTEQIARFNAPSLGLITATRLDAEIQGSCCVLENFIPTENGVRVRGGSLRRVNIPASVKYLFTYQKNTGAEYFASTDADIYKFTDATANGTALATPSLAGMTNADYSHLETQTDGGSFLLLVNGTDNLQVYNGTAWQTVTAVSTPFAITGIDTNLFNNVWNYNNRVFYIEKNSFNAWYTPINSIGGVATKLPLTGIFKRGGNLLFGASISSDAGDGYNDRCVFVTSKGEFAIYSGDPADVNSWALNGVFSFGVPIGKNAYIKIHGDVLVCTRNGFLSINSIMQQDDTLEILSKNVQADWLRDVGMLASNAVCRVAYCNDSNLIFISFPAELESVYVFNYNTKAWAKITNWDVNSLFINDCKLFFGGANGWVYRGDTGGYDDNDKIFSAKLAYNFMSFGATSNLKMATRIKEVWRHNNDFNSQVSVMTDFNILFPTPPNVFTSSNQDDSSWDTSDWDLASWGVESSYYKIKENWYGANAHGEFFAPAVQLTSGQPARLDCELISIDLAFKMGRGIA